MRNKDKRAEVGHCTSFKHLGAVVSDDGSKPEVLSRIAQATAALTKLKPIWRDNNISLGSKVKLMRSLVISIFLYACESWTLTAGLEKRTIWRDNISHGSKGKLMRSLAIGIQREIKIKEQVLGTVTSFKYLGAVVSDDGSKPEVLSRIAQATAALTKLKPIWRDNNISLGSKVKLMRSLVISIFLYACESWTLTAELEKRTQAFEMRCYRRLLNISYKDLVTMRRFAEISKQPLENMTNS